MPNEIPQEILAWMRQHRSAIVVPLDVLLDGYTDGHRYTRRTEVPGKNLPAVDGYIGYFEAGVVGASQGWYGLDQGVWVLLAGDGAIGAHTIVSHDTDATGAELTELTDGSTTVLHNHAAGEGPLDKQWYNAGDFGGTAGTLNWEATDLFQYRNLPTGEDRTLGAAIAVPPGWSSGDSIYVAVIWRPNDDNSNGKYWDCEVEIGGTAEGVAHTGWTSNDTDSLPITSEHQVEVDIFTITTSNPADLMVLRVNRDGTGDDFAANVQFVGAEVYI